MLYTCSFFGSVYSWLFWWITFSEQLQQLKLSLTRKTAECSLRASLKRLDRIIIAWTPQHHLFPGDSLLLIFSFLLDLDSDHLSTQRLFLGTISSLTFKNLNAFNFSKLLKFYSLSEHFWKLGFIFTIKLWSLTLGVQIWIISYILHIISLLTGDMNSTNWPRSQCVAS